MTIVERGICRSRKNLIFLEAGSAVEQTLNCHIGDYMEGYLTHRNITLFLLQQRALVVAFLRLLKIALLPEFLIIKYKDVEKL